MRTAQYGRVAVLALTCALAALSPAARAAPRRPWVEAPVGGSRREPPDLSRVARAAMPAVVSITTRRDDLQSLVSGEEAPQGFGSGFVIHPAGYVLTSAHVVEGASEVQVTLRSPRGEPERYRATVVGTDARTDVALLRIRARRPLPVLRLSSARRVDVADWVVVIGNPLGLQHSVTVGVVSFKGRTDVNPEGRDGDFDFLQTDASLNPGSSGGPVLDGSGAVVAVANAVNTAGQGIGFAVPVDVAKAVLPHLVAHGRVRRGWLGASLQAFTPEAAAAQELSHGGLRGVLVSGLDEDGPGARAGLRVGDVVVALDGRPVHQAHALRWAVAMRGVGRHVTLSLRREGRPVRLRVRLREAPPDEAPGAGPAPALAASPRRRPVLGAEVEDLLVAGAAGTGSPASLGARVRSVAPGSPLHAAGVATGDLVLRVNDEDVAGEASFLASLEAARSGSTVRLSVRRAGRTLALAFRKP